jgi:hypothetical protein
VLLPEHSRIQINDENDRGENLKSMEGTQMHVTRAHAESKRKLPVTFRNQSQTTTSIVHRGRTCTRSHSPQQLTTLTAAWRTPVRLRHGRGISQTPSPTSIYPPRNTGMFDQDVDWRLRNPHNSSATTGQGESAGFHPSSRLVAAAMQDSRELRPSFEQQQIAPKSRKTPVVPPKHQK